MNTHKKATHHKKVSRPTDKLIETSAINFTHKSNLIAKREIIFWKFLLVIVFIFGCTLAFLGLKTTDSLKITQARI